MQDFPQLTTRFRFLEQDELYDKTKTIKDGYYEHNECLFFTLLWKNGTNKESFIKDFIKLIARIRKPSHKYIRNGINIFDDFISFIDTGNTNIDLALREEFVKAIFTKGLYNWDNRNQKELDSGLEDKGIIKEGIKGYIGEVFYHLIREKHCIDNTFKIFPELPKDNPSEAGLDFTEIRKDIKGYYLIIGEVKSTDHELHAFKYVNGKEETVDNNYNEKPNEIIEQLSTRPEETFNEHCVYYEKYYGDNSDLDSFLDNINNYVYDLSGKYKTDRKRLYGIINFSGNICHHKNLFKSFKSKTTTFLSEEANTRVVNLIGISEFEYIRKVIGDIIFNQYLK